MISSRVVAVACVLVVGACSGGSDPGPSSSSSGSSSGGGSSSGTTDPGDAGDAGEDAAVLCTPGAFVFCRCADRQEGTKECLDGKSFGPCQPCGG